MEKKALEKLKSENSLHCTEPEASLPCSHKPFTCLSDETDESSTCHHISLRYSLILSSQQPWVFQVFSLCQVSSPKPCMNSSCPLHVLCAPPVSSSLILITLIDFCKEYIQSSSLCAFL